MKELKELEVDCTYEMYVEVVGVSEKSEEIMKPEQASPIIRGNRTLHVVMAEPDLGIMGNMFHDAEIAHEINDEIWSKYPVLSALVYTNTDLKHGLVNQSVGNYMYRIYPVYNDSWKQIRVHFKITSAFRKKEKVVK